MPFALALSSIAKISSEINALESSAASRGAKSSKLHFARSGPNKAKFKFSENEFIVGTSAEILIELVAGISEDVAGPGNGAPHDHTPIDIDSYCCTDTNTDRVRVLSRSAGGGQPHRNVDRHWSEQAKPLTDDKTPVQDVLLNFELEPRQLVFVGIIVRVTISPGKYEWFLCDPQVGNGPPGAGKIFEAISLTLF